MNQKKSEGWEEMKPSTFDDHLNEDAVNLLIISAKDLQRQLNDKRHLISVAQVAFESVLDNDEIVQVQVVVTRRKEDFIGDFETVETELKT